MEEVAVASQAGSNVSTILVVDEETQIGAARRAAVTLGHAQGLDTATLGRLAIVVTEAATNMLRHAKHGMVVLRALGATAGVEVLALDQGPGIRDVGRAMRDGYSTSGTAGQGLGGIRRLASRFGIYSQPEKGTALFARVTGEPLPRKGQLPRQTVDDRLGVICLPVRGEVVCGDAWRLDPARGGLVALVVDGLGHGAAAHAVSVRAVASFARTQSLPAIDALVAMDAALRGSRGAAVSIATLDEEGACVSFAGVGNVDARVANGERIEHFTPQNGIVGHAMPTVRGSVVPWPVDGRLIMHSDGISSRWRLEAYPGLATAHPALIAGVLFRDFRREREDATVLVLSAQPVAA